VNVGESVIRTQLEQRGFTVLRGGWPDFLALKDGHGLGVEVKGYGDSLSRTQRAMGRALGELGLPVLVVRSWEDRENDEVERLLASSAPCDLETAWRRIRSVA